MQFLKDGVQTVGFRPGLEVIKLFSSSAEPSMKFQLLINVKIVNNFSKFRFKTQNLVIYPAHKCYKSCRRTACSTASDLCQA